jgi:hypothetical protein
MLKTLCSVSELLTMTTRSQEEEEEVEEAAEVAEVVPREETEEELEDKTPSKLSRRPRMSSQHYERDDLPSDQSRELAGFRSLSVES